MLEHLVVLCRVPDFVNNSHQIDSTFATVEERDFLSDCEYEKFVSEYAMIQNLVIVRYAPASAK